MKPSVEERIADLRKDLLNSGDSEENLRIKAMVNSHLQIAELLASKLYDKTA
jgi:hypothetical protein